LADYADALERGSRFGSRIPLAVDGVLIWDDEKTTSPDPVSPLALAAAAGEPEPEPPAPVERAATRAPRPDGPYLTFTVVARGQAATPLPDQPDVVFVEGVSPELLLHGLGAIPDTLRPRTRERAQDSAAAPWAAYRPMVRVGVTGGWAYATQEDGAPQFTRPEVLRRVSAGTQAVALTKQGPEVRVTVSEDGVGRPEATRRVDSPRENHVAGPAGRPGARRLGVDLWPGSSAAYIRLLAELEGEFGIAYHPDEDADAELTSALLLPVLDDLDEAQNGLISEVRDFDLAGLVGRTAPDRLRAAFAAQLARLAAETRIDTYREVADVLERIGRGERVDLAPEDPLDLRMRTLAAEAWAARQMVQPSWRGDGGPVSQDDSSAWVVRDNAARALREFLQLPVPVAAATILHERMSVRWRTELADDLAGSSLP
jgi:hypothetical protein